MKEKKAQIAPITIAGQVVDGIRKADGEYGMSKAQFCDILGIIKNNFARDLKPVLEQVPVIIKISVEHQSRHVDFIPMSTLAKLIEYLAFEKNNQLARAEMSSWYETTLEMRFDEAFGVERQRQEYIAEADMRFKRVMARYAYTDIIKAKLIEAGTYDPRSWETRRVFIDETVKVNMALFGVPDFDGDRDTMDADQQQTISDFERWVARKHKKYPDFTVSELIDYCIEGFC